MSNLYISEFYKTTDEKIIIEYINENKDTLLNPDGLRRLPIHLYCRCDCKKSIEIITYLLYNYDINNITKIYNCPPYVGYYLYKIYNWNFYDKQLFLYMMITKLQRLIKVYLVKRKLC